MDKSQAIHSFWSGFGLEAYDENSVPDDATLPYISYSVSTDSIGNMITIYGSLWYRSESWEEISKKTDQISEYIDNMNPLSIDGGYAWIVKGSPFSQRMSDPSDDTIRRMYINLMAEFLTAH